MEHPLPSQSNTPDSQNEARLVRGAQAGDEQAFSALYEAYVDRVFRMIRLRVADEMTAEDLTSDTFIKAWDHLERYQPRGYSFGAWLFKIARNTVIDHYRTSRELESLEAADSVLAASDIESTVAQSEMADQLRRKLELLTDDQRAVLELRLLMDLSTEDVATILSKRAGAVRALQMRALRTLAEITEETDG